MAHVECGEHPGQVRPSQTAKVLVLEEISYVVPGEELTVHGRHEENDGRRHHEKGENPPPDCQNRPLYVRIRHS